MQMPPRLRPLPLVALLLVAPAAGAQEGQGGARLGAGPVAVTASTGHALVGDVAGWGGRVTLDLPRLPLALRVGAERLGGTGRRSGIACSGLNFPDGCPVQPLRDRARLVGLGGGGAVRVLGGPRAALALVGDLWWMSVRSETLGLTTGQGLAARKALWSAEGGAEARWVPLRAIPVALELGASVGRARPLERVADGYTPFEGSFRVARARLAVVWRPAG